MYLQISVLSCFSESMSITTRSLSMKDGRCLRPAVILRGSATKMDRVCTTSVMVYLMWLYMKPKRTFMFTNKLLYIWCGSWCDCMNFKTCILILLILLVSCLVCCCWCLGILDFRRCCCVWMTTTQNLRQSRYIIVTTRTTAPKQ